jgi:hypothetical protein
MNGGDCDLSRTRKELQGHQQVVVQRERIRTRTVMNDPSNSKAATRLQRAPDPAPVLPASSRRPPPPPPQHLRAPAAQPPLDGAVLVRCLAPSRFGTPDAPHRPDHAVLVPDSDGHATSGPAVSRTTRHKRCASSTSPCAASGSASVAAYTLPAYIERAAEPPPPPVGQAPGGMPKGFPPRFGFMFIPMFMPMPSTLGAAMLERLPHRHPTR